MSYDWLKFAFRNHQPIVADACYPNDPRISNAESWCSVSQRFLEWQIKGVYQSLGW